MSNVKKYYDLSQPVFDHCPGWPTYESTSVRYEANFQEDRFNAEQIKMNVHTGTHLDAPFHFFQDKPTIDKIELDLFQGDAIIVNLKNIIHPSEEITVAMLEPYKEKIQPGHIVILLTGWGQKRSLNHEYMYEWPYLGGEAAEWLANRQVRGVAIDTLSIGGWADGTGRPCHECLLSNGIWILEEILIPEELEKKGLFYLTAFPLKLRGFSGAPTRAVGIV